MKAMLSCLLISVLMMACAQKPVKQSKKEEYSPVVSFEQQNQQFSAQVQLPKNFKQKIPLVIIVHEWWGRTPYIMERAKMLTEEGYAALAVDLFGDNKTVEDPKAAEQLAKPFYQQPELAINRLNQYLELAKKDPHIDPDKIFVIGYCFGGSQVLNLAKSGAEVKGVVSFHGVLTPDFPARDLKAKVLVLNGAADPMVPAKEIKAFEQQMKKAKADYKIINYPGAKHAFTNPKATERGKKFNMPIAYNQKADQASWQELLKFLKQ